MPISEEGMGTGNRGYQLWFTHISGASVMVIPGMSPGLPPGGAQDDMDQVFQDLVDLFRGWDKVAPNSTFAAYKTVEYGYDITPTIPFEDPESS